ncbi:MAG: CorA family divalent cation transporter [Pyrinomonadaceae bacterium]
MKKNKPETAVYLYDANGSDEKLKLEDINLKKLNDKQLLWIDVPARDKKTIEGVVSALQIKNAPVKSILDISERPKIEKFEDFFRFFIISVKICDDCDLNPVPIDFLVGKNFVVSIHDDEVDYFNEFREREQGETQIGELDAESFVATLLDLHIVSYFRALEEIELRVDKFDEKVLKTDLDTDKFLSEMVGLRNAVSKLRRWFMPHRDVFYAFARPDFQQISQSDSFEQFKMLNQHFESAVDAIESSRDTVLSIFDLYATKSDQLMNDLIRKLTFLTLIIGAMGVIAGILGMNYEVDVIFKSSYGFWLTLAGMVLLAIGLSIFAKVKRWI